MTLAEIPTDAFKGCTHIQVSVDYRKGGTNVFHGNQEARGYELIVQAVGIEQHEGYRSVTFALFSTPGMRMLLVPAARLDRKKLAKIQDAIRPHADAIAQGLIQLDKPRIAAIAQGVVERLK